MPSAVEGECFHLVQVDIIVPFVKATIEEINIVSEKIFFKLFFNSLPAHRGEEHSRRATPRRDGAVC